MTIEADTNKSKAPQMTLKTFMGKKESDQNESLKFLTARQCKFFESQKTPRAGNNTNFPFWKCFS